MTSNSQKQGNAQGSPLKRWWNRVIVLLGIVMLLFVGLIFINPWLESLDAQWVPCTVTSAEAATASGGGRTARTSRPMVKIQTQQCGEVGIFNEITSENQQQIASELKPGQTYEFEMGWLSQRAAAGIWVFDWMFDPEATAFRTL
ncbi:MULTISPECIES: hypothetical protein [unclassified Pseudoclavibacter]|uniref:hypothetical protein n=1 Tax=unclassified Pseudoclavibacter TaxID=2615177 RepID=UPI0013016B14|nr:MULTISPECIES: hypothetical protein [unclassified Pseudoclavibacter]KAB1645748.1 hypothetical protein F8O06_09365 [Pseudoclavibacter sp. CFCC 14310]KAB1664343.1 hypothetical protein F8O08_02785 [Pseudoclavibacter sp. CFCC 13611]